MGILIPYLGLTDYILTYTEKNRIIHELNNNLIIDSCDGGSRPISWKTGMAVFSRDYKYRFLLTRVYSQGERTCVFIMLNPSIADGSMDDPTTRRCVKFSLMWGFDRLTIVNLFAYRTAYPRLLSSIKDPVGNYNDLIIKSTIQSDSQVVLGWGNRGTMLNRSEKIQNTLSSFAVNSMAFRLTNSGQPVHPLYIPSNASAYPITILRGNNT